MLCSVLKCDNLIVVFSQVSNKDMLNQSKDTMRIVQLQLIIMFTSLHRNRIVYVLEYVLLSITLLAINIHDKFVSFSTTALQRICLWQLSRSRKIHTQFVGNWVSPFISEIHLHQMRLLSSHFYCWYTVLVAHVRLWCRANYW